MSDEIKRKRRYTVPPNKAADSRAMPDEQWLAERFWPKVQKTDGCWEWMACVKHNGYGQVIYRGKKYRAHRVAKAVLTGIDVDLIPIKLEACHTCDNPRCVRPDHIFWGTKKENVMDSVRKGRWKQIKEKQA